MVIEFERKSDTMPNLSAGRKSDKITDLFVVIFELILPS